MILIASACFFAFLFGAAFGWGARERMFDREHEEYVRRVRLRLEGPEGQVPPRRAFSSRPASGGADDASAGEGSPPNENGPSEDKP